MAWDDKLKKIMQDKLEFGESCIVCRVYSKSKGIKLVVLGTENQNSALKFTKNVKILEHVEIDVGNRVLVAFINGNINSPVIVGRIK